MKIAVVLGLIAGTVFGASSLGSVSSMGPVEVSGTALAASMVSSWPLVGGDVIATNNSPAVVFITGKGRVTLDVKTRVRVARQGDQVSVQLLNGGLTYDLVPGSDVLFFNGARSIAPGIQRQGSIATTSAQDVLPKFSTVMSTRPTPSIIGP